MNISQIKRILSGLGYESDTAVQISELRALLMTTNQGMNHHEEFLTYDSENNLICIKKFKYKVISGRLSNNVTIKDNDIVPNGNNLYIRHSIYPFRAPRIGDNVFLINKDGKIVSDIFNIESISSMQITLSGSLSKFKNDEHFIVYADPSSFNKSVQDKETPALYFEYTPLSENVYDMYLDGALLLGVELKSSLPGSV